MSTVLALNLLVLYLVFLYPSVSIYRHHVIDILLLCQPTL
jgi:hypothetical protein